MLQGLARMRIIKWWAAATLIALTAALAAISQPAAAQTTLPACALTQAGGGDSGSAAVPCTRTIPGTGTVSVVYASGKTGILADDSPSVSGRVVTFTPSDADDTRDDDTGSAVYHIVVSDNGVELARYTITVTTYAAGQAPSAPAPTATGNVYKIEFIGDADGVVQPGKNVILKVTRVDGRLMLVGSSVESIEISGLSLAAVRRHYYKDNQRKVDHDGDSSTPVKGDADSDPDVATTVIAFNQKFAVNEVVFADRKVQSGIPAIASNAIEYRLGFSAVTRYGCWSKPKSSNPLETTNGAGTGGWGACGGDNRYNLGQPFTLTAALEIVIPSDAPSGQYVVTVKGPRTVGGSDMVTETRTLTVGSAPAVGTVSFGLSAPRRAQAGETDATDGYLNDASMREPATIAAGGGDNNTELTLTVLNASNKPAEANTVSSMVVTTTLGTLAAKAGQTPTCSGGATCAFDLSGLKSSGGALPEKVRVLLTSPAAPGTATVTATVVSGGRVFRPDAVQVRFTGPATTLTVGEAPGTVLGYNVGNDEAADYNAAVKADTGMDARDQLTFALEATDASGAAIQVPTLSAMVKTSEGALVAGSKYETSQSGAMKERLLLDIDAAMASALAAGTYTLELTSGTLKATTTFVVVGAADSVDLTLEPATATEIGQGVVARVMVTDAAGNAVADGTSVSFGVSDLVGDDDAVAVLDDETALTEAGKASTTLTVVGAGRAVVRATVSDDSTPERDVEVLVSTAGAPATVSAEAGLECLSALSGFATWVCGVESSASEVFGLVSPRGASAVHLWNGTAWIRYSVVGGTMVPGSSDFAVGEDDILYISN